MEGLDDDVGRVDANRDRVKAGLFTNNSVDIDKVTLAVNLGNFSLSTLESTSNNGDSVFFANRNGACL